MEPPPSRTQQFASDNNAGMSPAAAQWMLEAQSTGHEPAYGDDRWTQRAADRLRELFERDCDVYFVFNGTAANSLALASLCQSYHSVICAPTAHIETDECGGPEFFSNGSKLLLGDSESPSAQLGKLTPSAVEALVLKRTDIHYPKPKVLSVTQATELGTVYSIDELCALGETARHHQLAMHMDGARFANAVARLGCTPSEVTWKVGVDVLCFGGTKNGLAVGEAVVFFDRRLSVDFAWRVKQAGQLASKMRFIAAPWLGLLENDTWLANAGHANAMASRLYEAIRNVVGVSVMHEPQANSVFVSMAEPAIARLRDSGWRFYQFIGSGGCRFMCSWDTDPAAVDALTADIKAAVSVKRGGR
jgi:threonine aldolase